MIKTCLDYHQKTSYDRFEMSGHSLDWANQPKVFKEYPGIPSLPLPEELPIPKGKLSDVLKETEARSATRKLDLETLSLLLLLSYTHTARARSPEGEVFFRSAASAGALYPTEIYAKTIDVSGVDNGLYHFAIQNHSLDPLRKGDVSGAVHREGSRITFFLTAIFFRSAWKYRARAYRYHLLDTGHVAENLILALKALRVSFNVTYDFNDEEVNRFLGLDDEKEVALAIIDVPGGNGISEKYKEPVPPLSEPMRRASRVSAKETDYPAIREMHQAGIGIIGRESSAEMIDELGVAPKSWTAMEAPRSWPEIADCSDALFHRRSRRNFVKKALSKEAMNALLHSLCRSDGSPYSQSVAVGFLAGQAEHMDPGFYLLDRRKDSWALVFSGGLMAKSTSVCLDQEWLVNAGVHFLFLANLEVLEKIWGPRGYRYAMLTAGRLGERLYVAAEAMGLGCCGIGALYDSEAVEMLGLNQNSRLLYLVATGNVKRA